jgi:hypothetical protein
VAGAVEAEDLVGGAERVVRVDLLFPVDALVAVPLLVLALLVQGEQAVASLVVLPAEAGCAGGRDLPERAFGGVRTEVARRH